VQYVYASWSDAGAQSHTVTAPGATTTYTASFSTQYFLTTAANPPAGGAILPASGWYNSGTVVAVSASANAGYAFSGFTGALSGTVTPQNVTLSAAATVTANFSQAGGPAWYNAGWSNRKAVTVDHSKVAGGTNLSNFPLLYAVTADANVAALAQATGNDILFTAADGITKLNHEVEAYNAATGQLTAWVQVPALSPTVDTVIYIYYGNPGASNQQNKPGTWDASYKAVWHLSGAPLNAGDSTSNANNGAVSGATGGVGKIAGGGVFNGVSADIATPYTQSAVTGFTVEAWIRVTAGYANSAIVLQDRGAGAGHSLTFGLDGAGACGASSCFNGGAGKLLFADDSNSLLIGVESPAALNDGNWHHVAGTWASSAGTAVNTSQFSLYVDGVKILAPATLSVGSDAAPLSGLGGTLLGHHQAWNTLFGGTLDEVRISTAARTPEWIATQFANHNAPASFFSVGPQQVPGS
jgi:hypothetical protein